MTYADSLALMRADDFPQRVHLAVMRAAVDVMNEAGSTDVIQKRQALAQKMLWSAEGLEAFLRLVCLNTTIAAAGTSAPDGDIEFVVASVWDAMAGLTHDDVTGG